MTKRHFLSLALALCAAPLLAQVPQTVLFPGELATPLADEVRNQYKTFFTLGYGPARDTLYGTIDNMDGQVEGIYTGYKVNLPAGVDPSEAVYQGGAGLSAEHVYPQSKGAENEPARSDMHNLFPCKANVNSARSNCPFDEIPDSQTDQWFRLDVAQGNIPSAATIDEWSESLQGVNCRFEPREAKKGDIARCVFYFYTMYQPQANAADPNFFHDMKAILLAWHYADPVDQREYERSLAIGSYQQDKPNPFVLDSTLARRIYFPDMVVSSGQLASDALQIFPSLTQGPLLLRWQQPDAGASYQIFAADGRPCTAPAPLLPGENPADVSALPAGLYVLRVRSAAGQGAYRFVKAL